MIVADFSADNETGLHVMIETIAKDVTAKRETRVDGRTVHVTRTVRPNEDDPVRCVIRWAFDFSDVSDDELMTLATSQCVINAQRVWRASPTKMDDVWADRKWSVRQMIDAAGTREPVDPVTAANRALEKMSSAERAAFITSLENGS